MPESMKSEAKRVASLLKPENSVEFAEALVDIIELSPECVGCAAIRQPKLRPRISTRTIAWAALLVGLFLPPLFPLDEIIGTATAFRGPAIGFDELTLRSPTIRMGEPLIIHVKSEYERVCMWRWVHEWRTANNVPIAIDWLPGTAHALGAITEKDLALNPPAGIKPGNYLLRISGTGDCGHGDIAQHSEPDLAFTVTQ